MRALILIILSLIAPQLLLAQNLFFETIESHSYYMSETQKALMSKLQLQESVQAVYPVRINHKIFDAKQIRFKIKGQLITADLVKKNVRAKNNFSWFGKTDKNEWVFFSIRGDKVASKIRIGNSAYTFIPTTEGHLMIQLRNIHDVSCGNEFTDLDKPHRHSESGTRQKANVLSDDECTLRVLVATTTVARQEIVDAGFVDVPTFVQMAVDESNMIYLASEIDLTMELAVLIETNYVEVMGDDHASDLNSFRNGSNGLGAVLDSREDYSTDVQVLIRRNEQGVWGKAGQVPTAIDPFDASRAFCTVAVDGIQFDRAIFAHEVGHLQGARHDNDNNLPVYARGFVSDTSANAWRTVMSVRGRCTLNDFCHIPLFSNPNVLGPGSIPAGTNDRNNARRLNESANTVKNHRQVPNTLLLLNETVTANMISNHLAHFTIDTDNRNITYQQNSLSTMRSGLEIIMRAGTHVQEGASFRAYISDPACETLPELSQMQDGSGNNVALSEPDNLSDFNLSNLAVKVYPNPANSDLHIDFKDDISNYQVLIYDIQGTIVFQKDYEQGNAKISLNGFSKGVYMVTIINKDTLLNQRVIKL